jgi:hypothetical protein
MGPKGCRANLVIKGLMGVMARKEKKEILVIKIKIKISIFL